MPWSSTTRSTPRVLQRRGERDEVLERPSETVQFRDDELVAGARGDHERLVERGARGKLAAGLVDEDLVAASRGERVALAVEVLVAGGHSSVADTQSAQRPRTLVSVTLAGTRVALHHAPNNRGRSPSARRGVRERSDPDTAQPGPTLEMGERCVPLGILSWDV